MTNGHKLANIQLAYFFLDMNLKAKFSSWSLAVSSEKSEF